MESEDLIEKIAMSIVDKPEQVSVKSIVGANVIVIELKVDKNDVGKIIGKNGRTVTAIRTILNAARCQKDKRQLLEVLD